MSSEDNVVSDADSRSEAYSPTPSSINTASFIQSAARSVLDDTSPITALSDDGECSEAKVTPALQSLSIEVVPAMPEEQDRKRFVGCLAAVLASAYEYDIPDQHDHCAESRAMSMAYLEKSEQVSDDETECSHTEGHDGEDKEGLSKSANASFDYSEASFVVRQKANRKTVLSRNRHRRRRYDVLSKLLMQSAQLLLLDKSQARAFLPMLARVLVPGGQHLHHDYQETSPAPKKTPIWRRNRRNNNKNSNNEKNNSQQSVQGAKDQEKLEDQSACQLPTSWDQEDHLRPFLDSLSPGAGFRCLALLLLQHLLHSKEGYDSRVRHVLKKLGIIVLIHDMQRDPVEGVDYNQSHQYFVERATRKFESLEHHLATRLIRLSQEMKQQSVPPPNRRDENEDSQSSPRRKVSKEQIMRGIKIGSAGIVAGTLFAVTGGLAAPGIITGIAAIAGGTVVGTAAATAAGVLLTSTAAVTAIFGVGGGSLAAYKMNRRTQGLTEFEFIKENEEHSRAELFSTICISGWLRDSSDFQRPWGVHPRFADRMELLERFYSIYRPDHVPKCRKILASWKGEENQLWRLLRQTYGRDPNHLFPLEDGSRVRGALTLEQEEVLDQLFVDLGYFNKTQSQENNASPIERMNDHFAADTSGRFDDDSTILGDSMHGPSKVEDAVTSSALEPLHASFTPEQTSEPSEQNSEQNAEHREDSENEPPKHLATVWDYRSRYGGEMYTVQWESNMLTEVCDSVTDLAFDVVSGSTTFILRQTAFASLLSAVAIPYVLVNAANMIDSSWTLAVERSDEAGRELARSLLYSRAGHRPVTLIGFSFGARAIYSCLKELAQYQEKWESQRERKHSTKVGRRRFKQEEEEVFIREPASIVEDAIIMGLPNHLSVVSWRACRQIVSGRLVNCYSRKDLILSLMFQLKRFAGALRPVCGTCPVEIPGVENIDVTDLISGHQDYCIVTGDIMDRVRHGQPRMSSPEPKKEES